jgi:NADH dehydrogenase
VREHALGLKDLSDANAVRNRILRNFERAAVEPDAQRRAQLMTMVVVGGGPTGVELAGALADLRQHVLRRDHPELDMAQARVILLEAGESLLPSFPPRLRRRGLEQLRSLGVEVQLGALVTRVDEEGVELREGAPIASANVIWVAGTRGSPLAAAFGVVLTRDGRVPVTETLELPGRRNVYVIGDLASLMGPDGRPYPMLAQVALQQAALVAKNIHRSLRGEPQQHFRYRDRGTMATVGRRRAIAHVFGLQFSGLLAWLLWLAVHLLAIISLRNRALVLLNWVWNYVRYDRANRLLTDDEREL